MEEVRKLIEEQDRIRDLRPVVVPHGVLRDLLQRLYIAEQGMKIEQAKIHAEVSIAQFKDQR
jgi:hypothetical protein